MPGKLALRRLPGCPGRLLVGTGFPEQRRRHEGIPGPVQAACLSWPLVGPAENELLAGAKGSVCHDGGASSR